MQYRRKLEHRNGLLDMQPILFTQFFSGVFVFKEIKTVSQGLGMNLPIARMEQALYSL
jgi:hypothetical protein